MLSLAGVVTTTAWLDGDPTLPLVDTDCPPPDAVVVPPVAIVLQACGNSNEIPELESSEFDYTAGDGFWMD